jgi:predicted kinase
MPKKQITSDEDRLKELERVYTQQTTEALITGKLRKVATMKTICTIANVDPTYVYGKNNPTPEALKKYLDFQEKVNDFAETFKNNKANLSSIEDEKLNLLESAREHLFKLEIENTDLVNKLKKAHEKQRNLQAEVLEAQVLNNSNKLSHPSSQLNSNTINVISPDDTLQYNKHYEFFDDELKEKAWDEAREKFQHLIKRKVPQRIYLLVGLPCSGKSEWAKAEKVLHDRHAVIIDATNLTKGERALWINLARKGQDIKVCAVVFLTDFLTIKERNIERLNQNKFIDVSILEAKKDKSEPIDIKFEDVDEMIIVRED